MYRSALQFMGIPIIWLAISGTTNAQSPKERPVDFLLNKNAYPLLPNAGAEIFLKQNGITIDLLDKKYPLPQDPKKILKYRESRLKGIRNDLADTIAHFGKSQSSWAGSANEAIEAYCHFLSHRQDFSRHGVYYQYFQESLKRAIAAGCTDPLILMMHERYQERDELKNADIQKATELIGTLDKKIHPHFLIATLALDCRIALLWNDSSKPNAEKEKLARTLSEMVDQSIMEISTSTKSLNGDTLFGLISIHSKAIANLERKSSNQIWKRYDDMLSKSKGHHWLRAMLEGKMWYESAWEARGKGFSDTVTPEGQSLFEQNMKKAERKLEEAWKLDPTLCHAADYLIGVMTALARDRSDMEMWFIRAMECNPDNFFACSQKLNYLQPNWHGTRVDYFGFMFQCYRSNNNYSGIPRLFEGAVGAAPKDPELQLKFFATPGIWANYHLMANVHLNHYRNDRFVITRMVMISLKAKQWDSAVSYHEMLDGKPPWPGVFASIEEYKKLIEFAEKQ